MDTDSSSDDANALTDQQDQPSPADQLGLAFEAVDKNLAGDSPFTAADMHEVEADLQSDSSSIATSADSPPLSNAHSLHEHQADQLAQQQLLEQQA